MIEPRAPLKPKTIAAPVKTLLTRVPFRFAAGMMLLLVYGSLLPFTLRPPVHGVLEIGWLSIGEEGRADWLANGILYIPLGFLLMGARTRRSFGWGVVTFLIGASLAVVIESAQIIISPRTVSLNDLLAELIGLLVGILLWAQFGPLLLQGLTAINQRNEAGLRALLSILIGVLGVVALFPFDFVVSTHELAALLDRPERVGVLPANCGGLVACGLGLGGKVLLGATIGLLTTLLGIGLLATLFLAMACAFSIEALQFFMVSGRVAGVSILAAALGAGAGVWAMRLASRAPSRIIALANGLAKALLPLYLLALPLAHGLKLQGFADGPAIYRAAAQLNFLPFYYHYYTTEQNALASSVLVLASMLPLGIAMGFIVPFVRSTAVVMAGFLLTALLETAKLLQLAERPDPTNLLIGALGTWLGLILTRWFVAMLPNLSERRA
jgi:VanZ family protein